MKILRKWGRIIHRDLGFFLVGTTLIYALSGIALNHLKDWNPSYSVDNIEIETSKNLKKGVASKDDIKSFLADYGLESDYKSHYYPEKKYIKIFLGGGSSIIINTSTGKGNGEILSKRLVFYDVNYLHYNPNKWWMWFSDFYAAGLIILVITSLVIVRGKKGLWGRGGIYIIAGILIPILFLIFL